MTDSLSDEINPSDYEHLMQDRDIRCMPTYPLTIEDVQAYLERV